MCVVGRKQRRLRPGASSPPDQLLYGLLLPSGADAAYALRGLRSGHRGVHREVNATAGSWASPGPISVTSTGCPGRPSTRTTPPPRTCSRWAGPRRVAAFRSIVDQRTTGSRRIRTPRQPVAGASSRCSATTPANRHEDRIHQAAGQCLLFEATRNGYTVIGVTLHSPVHQRPQPSRRQSHPELGVQRPGLARGLAAGRDRRRAPHQQAGQGHGGEQDHGQAVLRAVWNTPFTSVTSTPPITAGTPRPR